MISHAPINDLISCAVRAISTHLMSSGLLHIVYASPSFQFQRSETWTKEMIHTERHPLSKFLDIILRNHRSQDMNSPLQSGTTSCQRCRPAPIDRPAGPTVENRMLLMNHSLAAKEHLMDPPSRSMPGANNKKKTRKGRSHFGHVELPGVSGARYPISSWYLTCPGTIRESRLVRKLVSWGTCCCCLPFRTETSSWAGSMWEMYAACPLQDTRSTDGHRPHHHHHHHRRQMP